MTFFLTNKNVLLKIKCRPIFFFFFMCAAFNGNGQTEAKVHMEGCLEGDGFVGFS